MPTDLTSPAERAPGAPPALHAAAPDAPDRPVAMPRAVADDRRAGPVPGTPTPPEACDAVRRTAGEVRRADVRRRRGGMAPRYQTRPDVGDEALPPALVGLLAALRASVTVYVCGRRGEGAPIERVLPEVKTLVREVEVDVGSLDTLAPLIAQVVRWTIEAYYDHPVRVPVPRAG